MGWSGPIYAMLKLGSPADQNPNGKVKNRQAKGSRCQNLQDPSFFRCVFGLLFYQLERWFMFCDLLLIRVQWVAYVGRNVAATEIGICRLQELVSLIQLGPRLESSNLQYVSNKCKDVQSSTCCGFSTNTIYLNIFDIIYDYISAR